MIFTKLFGTKSDREIKKLSNIISQINQQYENLASQSDEGLVERTKELKEFVMNSRKEKENSLPSNMDQEERKKEKRERPRKMKI